MLVSMAAVLSGCPKECKTQSDCGKGEVCQAYNLASDPDDAPRRYACVPSDTEEGGTIAGVKVTKCDVGTNGITCTVEPAK